MTVGSSQEIIDPGISAYGADRVVLACSLEYEEKTRAAVAKWSSVLSRVVFDCIVLDAFSQDAYYKMAESILDTVLPSHDNGEEWMFNVTGGTKLMVLAAQLAAQILGCASYYVVPPREMRNPDNDQTIRVDEEQSKPEIIEVTPFQGTWKKFINTWAPFIKVIGDKGPIKRDPLIKAAGKSSSHTKAEVTKLIEKEIIREDDGYLSLKGMGKLFHHILQIR